MAQADHLIVESTYGNRKHSAEQAADALEAVITRTVRRGGTVVIPAFAVGRAQALLYYIWQLKQAGRIARDLPVFLDSPMASGASMSIFGTPVTNACRRPTRGRRSAWRPM